MVPNGKIIYLDPKNSEDLQFVREAYGYAAEDKGWFRERDRLFVFSGALKLNSAKSKLRGAAPPGILDVPMPPRPDGPISRRFLTMDDGTIMRWIRHPSVLPKSSQPHWRGHTALFELKGQNPDFVCYTSIPSFAVVDGADGKCPFNISDKIKLIKNYVAKVLRWSRRYDLPPQVISDRILFRSTQRRRLLGQRQTDQLLEKLRQAFNGDNRSFEQDLVNEYTKRGFFYGPGRYKA